MTIDQSLIFILESVKTTHLEVDSYSWKPVCISLRGDRATIMDPLRFQTFFSESL